MEAKKTNQPPTCQMKLKINKRIRFVEIGTIGIKINWLISFVSHNALKLTGSKKIKKKKNNNGIKAFSTTIKGGILESPMN